MSTMQRINLGPTTSPLQQGRSPHGRWRLAYQQASSESPFEQDVSESDLEARTAALRLIQDAERLVLALTEGPAAAFLAEQLAEHLWIAENADGEWPENLRDWLDHTDQWTDAPAGRTGFICGRLERSMAGGRIYLAWLGLSGVHLYNRSDSQVELDTLIGTDEGWTRENGPEPEGMALHAYRGSLFGLERLIVASSAAEPLLDDLPDMAHRTLEQALADWAVDAKHDLSLFDLRLQPVLNKPNSLLVNYQWISPDQVELSWHPSPNATAYRVEEASTSDFADASRLAELTDGRQSHYQFSPPIHETRYYRVIPLNQGVAGQPSDPVDPTPIMLNPPIMDRVQWADDGGYFLSWSPIRQATSYEVQSSPDADFSPHDSQIVYRGELPETYLSHTGPIGFYYRVRAINALYAPRSPSTWSNAIQAPYYLPKPVFTNVTQQRIEWEPITGAQQYIVRVTTNAPDGAQRVEEVALREPGCVVADQHAVYHVRAFRRTGDDQTASPWSEGVVLSPKEGLAGVLPNVATLGWVLGGLAVVALLIGIALGWLGGEAIDNANATDTPTPYPKEIIDQTQAAATLSVRRATAIQVTLENFMGQTATAIQWTATPTPTNTPNLTETVEMAVQAGLTATADQWTATPPPTDTPDMTETVAAVFQAGLTATADQWTATPLPTDTPDMTETVAAAFQAGLTATATQWTATPPPTNTPNATRTIDAAFRAGLTATATQWTAAPPPTNTPNATRTIDAAFRAGLTATATQWTATPIPTHTPNTTRTIDAAVRAKLTATAQGWTPTPIPSNTPDIAATVDTLILADQGLPADVCVVINQTGILIPVYETPDTNSPVLFANVPQLARIGERQRIEGDTPHIWLAVSVLVASNNSQDTVEINGWLQVPPNVDERLIYGGDACPLE